MLIAKTLSKTALSKNLKNKSTNNELGMVKAEGNATRHRLCVVRSHCISFARHRRTQVMATLNCSSQSETT
jgi:hypothetical protein